MNVLRVFIPHILGIVGAVLWLGIIVQFTHQNILLAVMAIIFYFLLFFVLVGFTPSSWLRAMPTDNQNADIAVILSFGYQMEGDKMKPGEANQYLWEWMVNNKPSQLRTILVQEGVWVAAAQENVEYLELEVMRIHRHDPRIYVDTLNAVFCAIQQIQRLGKKKIMLVAHDLQIQRLVWDFARVSRITCPDCTFVIPEISDVPYPTNSAHFQTRSEFIYKIIELLIARPRDFLNQIPTRCVAPIPN